MVPFLQKYSLSKNFFGGLLGKQIKDPLRHSSEAFSDLHIMLLFSENMSQTYFLFPGIFFIFIPLSDRQKTRIVFYRKDTL